MIIDELRKPTRIFKHMDENGSEIYEDRVPSRKELMAANKLQELANVAQGLERSLASMIKDRDEWQSLYMITKDELTRLEIIHSNTIDELEQVKAELKSANVALNVFNSSQNVTNDPQNSDVAPT